eukprot:CAMPEP_0174324580 /NCGR_PEP_ID=MMETSP0810-20121108/12597_1 /TAXON_ID=73025 ORGANISM="Eutreptiella gymnastica-like, Strain CCMP1594" /NCGR_SAMPLE_ID=MMETSP0810 /ASSEMBLY_ACC=CAM_ASM_000659 /LENGTH=109 /DNA_ID=CAMNT_0015437445 /DNA_START=240 /DNA_END=569 /DNA_ORIENTATION=-
MKAPCRTVLPRAAPVHYLSAVPEHRASAHALWHTLSKQIFHGPKPHPMAGTWPCVNCMAPHVHKRAAAQARTTDGAAHPNNRRSMPQGAHAMCTSVFGEGMGEDMGGCT